MLAIRGVRLSVARIFKSLEGLDGVLTDAEVGQLQFASTVVDELGRRLQKLEAELKQIKDEVTK